jgi:hypothetical protein
MSYAIVPDVAKALPHWKGKTKGRLTFQDLVTFDCYSPEFRGGRSLGPTGK